MSCWSKPELETMLRDVVEELNLSDGMIEEHGPLGTAPADLVRIVLERKESELCALNVLERKESELCALKRELRNYKAKVLGS